MPADRIPYDKNPIVKIEPALNGRNYGGEKEQISCYAFVAPNPAFNARTSARYKCRYVSAITIRCWKGRSAGASTIYASVWAHSRDGETELAGTGRASGYWYHKESTAIAKAMCSAGVTFKGDFGGTGEGPTFVAIESLARRLGWRAGQVMTF